MPAKLSSAVSMSSSQLAMLFERGWLQIDRGLAVVANTMNRRARAAVHDFMYLAIVFAVNFAIYRATLDKMCR